MADKSSWRIDHQINSFFKNWDILNSETFRMFNFLSISNFYISLSSLLNSLHYEKWKNIVFNLVGEFQINIS